MKADFRFSECGFLCCNVWAGGSKLTRRFGSFNSGHRGCGNGEGLRLYAKVWSMGRLR